MQWEISFVLLMGLCLLVCTAPVLRTVTDSRAYTHTSFPNGTVVLLSPIGEIRTAMEKLVGGTPITHVGVVWVDACGVPFIFHTTPATGARLELFLPWIRRATRRSQVFVRRIQGPSLPDGASLERALMPFLGTSYSFGFWKAVMQTWWPGMEMPRAANPKDRFCSELVADVLARVGVLDFSASALTPRLVLPGDFWCTIRIPFVNGYTLLSLEELVYV